MSAPSEATTATAGQRRKRLLCLAVKSPEHAENGDAIRVLGLLESISGAHDTHFISSAEPDRVARSRHAMATLTGGTVEIFPRRSRKPFPSLQSVALWVRAFATLTPAPTAAHRDPAIARYLRRAAHHFDGVVLLDNAVAVYMPELRAASAVIVDVHNVAGWSMALPEARRSGRRLGRMRQGLGTRLMRTWERRTLADATAITITSSEEDDRLHELYGLRAGAVVPSGSVFPETPLRGRATGTVGWLGGLGYGPNRDGLLRFLRDGWGEVAAAGFRLEVAGGGADDDIKAWDGTRGVSVRGFVEDLEKFLRGVDVAVVPLWAGAGVKLKTVTFLGAGIPVVTTPVGAEGTGIRDGEHAVVAETPAGLARALITLLQAPEKADTVARAGRDHALSRLTWDVCGGAFSRVVDDAIASAPARSEKAPRRRIPAFAGSVGPLGRAAMNTLSRRWRR